MLQDQRGFKVLGDPKPLEKDPTERRLASFTDFLARKFTNIT
jgi:hypothetical protein